MSQTFLVCFLLFFFWQFYYSSLPHASNPTSNAPDKPDSTLKFFKKLSNSTYQLEYGADWVHTFPKEVSYIVQMDKIIEHDPCYPYVAPTEIPATGLALYDFIRKNPTRLKYISTSSNNPYTIHENSNLFNQNQNPFYFTCYNKRITNLRMCPSGQYFKNRVCHKVSDCTDKPDGTLLSNPSDLDKFVECKNGRPFPRACPTDYFFDGRQCAPKDTPNNICSRKGTTAPIKMDDKTLFECQNYRAVYTYCPKGTRLFEHNICEEDDCVNKLDYEIIPLQDRGVDPFYFFPGYIQCFNKKIHSRVECPQTWNHALMKEVNLTSLPMVYDTNLKRCVIPSLCENVTLTPDGIAPVYEFTKHVKNWKFAERFDSIAGYECVNGRKRKTIITPGHHIKLGRIEPACNLTDRIFMPIYESRNTYYDCTEKKIKHCGPNEFFNGVVCTNIPENVFQYKNIPLFNFDSLNSEHWIGTWDRHPRGHPVVEKSCIEPDSEYLKVYDICSHKECSKYPFLSMIPDLSIFLPLAQRGKCTFDPKDRYLRKKTTEFFYGFWKQEIWYDKVIQNNNCTFGEKLKTGNFIWDSTIFATCDENEPFIFCPSIHTTKLIYEKGAYACEPPKTNVIYQDTADWTPYTMNEFKRVLPAAWDGTPFYVKLNKGQNRLPSNITETGIDIPIDTRLNLQADKPVNLELRYRVTHPPHVAFKYDAQRETVTSDTKKAFFVRNQQFTDSPMKFPTYKPQSYVPDFESIFPS